MDDAQKYLKLLSELLPTIRKTVNLGVTAQREGEEQTGKYLYAHIHQFSLSLCVCVCVSEITDGYK